MRKMKTHSGAKKRFKITKKKKIKYKKSGQRHFMIGDNSDKSRKSRKSSIIKKSDMKTILKLMPYEF
jgi:large subunit ribosomal protein L35